MRTPTRLSSFRIVRGWFLVSVLAATIPFVAFGSSLDYTVGPRDVLAISVWGHTDLSRDYLVGVEGFILFPLVGRVQAGGRTTKELETILTEKLGKDYLVNPQIVVTVREYLSQKVMILGDAERPGVYRLTAVDSSLLEVMTKAGGLSRTAGKQIVLVRPRRESAVGGSGVGSNGYAILHLDLEKIQEAYQKGDPSGNIRLQNDDTIFIPKASSYFVLGEVRKAGTFPLTGRVTAFDAVLASEGFKETAVQSAVKVLRRRPDGKQEALSIDLAGGPQGKDRDFVIQSGDTLVVPKGNSFFVFGEVKSPGAYHLDGNLNLLDAIVRAGGFTERASPGRTRVLRSSAKGREVIQVDMNDVIKRGQREKAIAIRAEDVIIVPESFF